VTKAHTVVLLKSSIEWRGKLMEWAEKRGIALSYIQPGNRSRMPMSNAITEPSDMNGSTNTSSQALREYGILPPSGYEPGRGDPKERRPLKSPHSVNDYKLS